MEKIEDLKVLPMATFSDHVPVSLYLYNVEDKHVSINENNNYDNWKTKFDVSRSNNFMCSMRWRDEVGYMEGNIDDLNKNLLIAISEVSQELAMKFRRRRGCLDNLFSLQALIQIHLRHPRSAVYAAFVDFKSAFPSVSHSLLWRKLYSCGLSTKFIKVLKSFYDQASAAIKTGQDLTDFVKVTRRVLQEAVMSPQLFSIFTSDVEKFLKSKGCRDLAINNLIEVLVFAYADDIVLLSDTPLELSKKLEALRLYCLCNDLTVNVNKTKIVIFRRNANLSVKHFKSFMYEDEKIEVVNCIWACCSQACVLFPQIRGEL